MAGVKDKVVTVESLSALHEHNKNTYRNKTDIIPIANGGTGSNQRASALANLNGTNGTPSHTTLHYSTLKETSLVTEASTTEDVLKKMPINCTIVFTTTLSESINLTDAPNPYGLVTLSKGWSDTFSFGRMVDTGSGTIYEYKTGVGWRSVLTNILPPYCYGDALPEAGTKGRIFFKRVVE